jgi:hypothetical protein
MKSALRRLLDNRLAVGARSFAWRKIAVRDSLATRQIAAEAGYDNLDVHRPFLADKGSSTLFILGSGSSILDLTDAHFEHIRQHASVGINVWAIHPFVPDAYCFETGQETSELGADTAYINRHLKKTLRSTKPVFLFLRPRNSSFLQNMVSPPEGSTGLRLMYGRTNLVSRRPSNLETDIRRVVRGYRNQKTPNNVLLDNGASVARVILLGALQGFKTIVLVGVDLDSRPYFWQSPDYRFGSNEIRQVFSRPSGNPHDTLETLNRPFPTDRFVEALSKVVGEELSSTVFVGSPDSKLAKALPVYRWP